MVKFSVPVLLVMFTCAVVGSAQQKPGAISIKYSRFASLPDLPAELSECALVTKLDDIKKADPADRVELRNRSVRAAQRAVLENEEKYMSTLDFHRNGVLSALDVVGLGLTAAAGAVGGPQAARAFAIAATGLAGTKSTYIQYFDPTTGGADLVSRIQQSFSRNYALLEQKLLTPYAQYSLSDACNDVELLRDSGTKRPSGPGIAAAPVVMPPPLVDPEALQQGKVQTPNTVNIAPQGVPVPTADPTPASPIPHQP